MCMLPGLWPHCPGESQLSGSSACWLIPGLLPQESVEPSLPLQFNVACRRFHSHVGPHQAVAPALCRLTSPSQLVFPMKREDFSFPMQFWGWDSLAQTALAAYPWPITVGRWARFSDWPGLGHVLTYWVGGDHHPLPQLCGLKLGEGGFRRKPGVSRRKGNVCWLGKIITILHVKFYVPSLVIPTGILLL